jgi:hypothetical protein
MLPSPELKKITDNLEVLGILELRYDGKGKIYVLYYDYDHTPNAIRNNYFPGWRRQEYSTFEKATEDILLVNNNF